MIQYKYRPYLGVSIFIYIVEICALLELLILNLCFNIRVLDNYFKIAVFSFLCVYLLFYSGIGFVTIEFCEENIKVIDIRDKNCPKIYMWSELRFVYYVSYRTKNYLIFSSESLSEEKKKLYLKKAHYTGPLIGGACGIVISFVDINKKVQNIIYQKYDENIKMEKLEY